jgi:hypothetical protein
MRGASKVFGVFETALHKRFIDDHLGSDIRQFTFLPISTCFRSSSKFLCIRSTPTEGQSTSGNDFECLGSSGRSYRQTRCLFPRVHEVILDRSRVNATARLPEAFAQLTWRPSELDLQLQLQDASRYRCTLEVAIGAARWSYSVLHCAKGRTSYHTIRIAEVRMVEDVVCIGA